MSVPVVLRDEAQAEFDEAFDYYEGKQPGLGVAFAERVQEVFNRTGANPLLHAVVFAWVPVMLPLSANTDDSGVRHAKLDWQTLPASTTPARSRLSTSRRVGGPPTVPVCTPHARNTWFAPTDLGATAPIYAKTQ
jgi:hypothetical protein